MLIYTNRYIFIENMDKIETKAPVFRLLLGVLNGILPQNTDICT